MEWEKSTGKVEGKVVWEEDVNRMCIVHINICFTGDSQLDTKTKKELRIVYWIFKGE